mmetsp:Transcript_31511/g.68894  ORF Transcript_31511/g.68894 Transcript_31511/m.68894 type:complete len:250 (+) Transcript_31511:112-861(+)
MKRTTRRSVMQRRGARALPRPTEMSGSVGGRKSPLTGARPGPQRRTGCDATPRSSCGRAGRASGVSARLRRVSLLRRTRDLSGRARCWGMTRWTIGEWASSTCCCAARTSCASASCVGGLTSGTPQATITSSTRASCTSLTTRASAPIGAGRSGLGATTTLTRGASTTLTRGATTMLTQTRRRSVRAAASKTVRRSSRALTSALSRCRAPQVAVARARFPRLRRRTSTGCLSRALGRLAASSSGKRSWS